MEPIPETARAIEEFGPFALEDEDLLLELLSRARQVQSLVPECLGLSLTAADDVTFTVVASAQEMSLLDGLQYLTDGPCVRAIDVADVKAYTQDELLDEDGWQLFARGTAATRIASTLTLPLREGERVVGSVNLYAATPHAFDGHHDAIARIFGAWALGAVTNADLSFSTRAAAERAPDALRDELDVTVASGLVATREGIDLHVARDRLRDAALRARVSESELARTIIELNGPQSAH